MTLVFEVLQIFLCCSLPDLWFFLRYYIKVRFAAIVVWGQEVPLHLNVVANLNLSMLIK